MSYSFVESKEFVDRAMRAYFAAGRKDGHDPDYPSQYDSDVEQAENDRYYVVLRNCNGILAVFRVCNDDTLKRLKRWPAELDQNIPAR